MTLSILDLVIGALLTVVVPAVGWTLRALSNHANRITALESSAEHAPDHADMQLLHGRISDVGKAVATLTGEQAAGNRPLSTIHQVLLQQNNEQQ